MAAFGASFESENSIEDRKENKRKARQEVVEKAKQCYEREEKKKELKKLRGEDTWMLPELDQRLKQIGQEDSLQSKKRKKEKKSKKAKKEKKKKKRDKKEKRAGTGDGCSDSSEDSEEEWVEAQPQPETVKGWKIPAEAKAAESSRSPAQDAKRDEWMTFDFLAMKTTSTTERRAEKDRLKGEEKSKAEAIEQAGLHKLELNPFWKDGGSGLPPEKNAVAVAEAKRVSAVNDGGLSWLKKSYQRMREQAERDNCSLNEIVAQRYGSMEEFQKRLAEAEEAAYGAPRRGGNRGMGRGNWRRGDRDSWRRGEGDTADREGWGRNERERDTSPRDGGRRWERSGEPREQGSERERGPGEGRYRERDRSRDRNRGEDDRDGERKRRSMDRDEERPRERERANNRRTDQDREGDGDRERYRDGPRERDGGRSGGSDRAPRDDRPSCREDSSPGRGRHTPPLSLGSLKGRFLKPSEDEDGGVRRSAPDPARLSKAFLKPSSDDEDSPKTVRQHHGVPPSRRESGPAQGTDRPTAPHHGDRVVTEATAPHGNKAAVTSSSEESEEEELPLLTDEEMNKLGAKLVKAEIMGNTALVDKLKSQMELARKAKENHATRLQQANAARASQPPGRSEEDKEVLLFRTDHSGRAWPVNAPSEPQEPHGGRRKRKPIETHVDGERVRYFQDDDSMGLQEMVRREKMSTPQDQNALYSRMAGKMMGKADGDNYTLDDMFVSSAAQREGEGRDEERMRSQAVAESRRLAASMDQCPRCFNSQELQKHLIVAIGAKSYLSLPAGVSMTEGHCLISPLQHHCSATGLDEDIWSEMQLFRRSLVRMFESQDQDCVFMETHMNPRRRQHMVLECVPLPRELGDMAPIYYKKAIMDCDEEWAMNKKVVNLSSKDIRQAVPRGLPYFAVDFGLQGGFAHVIENEQKFPHYFGKEVVGGMMDLEPRRWRKPIRENFDDQRKKVLQFAQWWKPYDCTKTDG
ncbi:CWF19-like protein 2 [Gadus macrocephalus]|uniref:CWF19-like protein 2 n=1 Tax=Gadus macrocephalus TaxID=80720 RepID=UPI0028CB5DCB|nr:CWF19-like protein 2 [Gadus macrocephalus]